ncbi:Competence protein F, phosphoribosyltransferase domain protein [Vulgatibacter incomptus]|uniref:Competence protein F, phosphoribosyltransferase domain protein n=1 Tax=Vulgatibacter incomptus TaxID=1391653 RepID=A0A0K1PFG7_9BACT|nr:Competence protein F, phosphoribosyltransferase domain protein [Vulgatibacter incomptus]
MPPPSDVGGRARRSAPEACATCTADPPAFSEVISAFAYGGAAAEAVQRLKYRGRREVASSLGGLVATSCASRLQKIDVVAPIPLHPSRRSERGYDQALLLARAIAREARKPLRPELLRRVRQTPGQVGSSRVDRLANLEGAFEAGPEASGLRVALVDDVVTTGATAASAAKALARAGASRVVILSVARAG